MMLQSPYLSTSKILYFLLAFSPEVFSYSITTNGPHAKPFGLQDISSVHVKETTNGVVAASAFKRRQTSKKYDLGLGKNKPLYGGKRQQQQQASQETTTSTVEFLVEHEAVNVFPSPLDDGSNDSNISSKSSSMLELQKLQQQQRSSIGNNEVQSQKKKRRQLPKVHLQRKSQDLLYIDPHRQNGLPHMTMKQDSTSTPQKVKMDMNTAWVEMLIHSEQYKKMKPATV